MKTLYMLAYQWALDKEPALSPDEIESRVNVITDYLDFVWKHKPGKASKTAPIKNPGGAGPGNMEPAPITKVIKT